MENRFSIGIRFQSQGSDLNEFQYHAGSALLGNDLQLYAVRAAPILQFRDSRTLVHVERFETYQAGFLVRQATLVTTEIRICSNRDTAQIIEQRRDIAKIKTRQSQDKSALSPK